MEKELPFILQLKTKYNPQNQLSYIHMNLYKAWRI